MRGKGAANNDRGHHRRHRRLHLRVAQPQIERLSLPPAPVPHDGRQHHDHRHRRRRLRRHRRPGRIQGPCHPPNARFRGQVPRPGLRPPVRALAHQPRTPALSQPGQRQRHARLPGGLGSGEPAPMPGPGQGLGRGHARPPGRHRRGLRRGGGGLPGPHRGGQGRHRRPRHPLLSPGLHPGRDPGRLPVRRLLRGQRPPGHGSLLGGGEL